VVPGPEHSQGGCAGPRRLDPHIPPGLCLREPKKNVGRRHHAVTASSIPVLGVSQHEGVTPFVKRRRQPSEPAREKLRRQGTAHRHRRGSTEATGGATKKSEAARASAASAPRRRSEKLEVQRRAQRQLLAAQRKSRSATAGAAAAPRQRSETPKCNGEGQPQTAH
jgi:hypothetical protein